MGEIMKIVSWNCGMAFYANKKYKLQIWRKSYI